MSIPVEFFPEVDGSMTSEDGQTFYLRVRREDGADLMLGFPHEQISNIVECAAMQLDRGRDPDGKIVASAFNTTGFALGRGPEGETVLSLQVGETGQISFVLPADVRGQLNEGLTRFETKH